MRKLRSHRAQRVEVVEERQAQPLDVGSGRSARGRLVARAERETWWVTGFSFMD